MWSDTTIYLGEIPLVTLYWRLVEEDHHANLSAQLNPETHTAKAIADKPIESTLECSHSTSHPKALPLGGSSHPSLDLI